MNTIMTWFCLFMFFYGFGVGVWKNIRRIDGTPVIQNSVLFMIAAAIWNYIK